MAVTYRKLFKLMIDKKMKKKELKEMTGISASSVSKLANDQYVSLKVLEQVCNALSVNIGDIVEITDSNNRSALS